MCDKNGHFLAHWLPRPKFGSGDINKQIFSTFLTFHKICQCRSLQKSLLDNIRGIIRPNSSKVSPRSASFQRLLFSPYGYLRGGACISYSIVFSHTGSARAGALILVSLHRPCEISPPPQPVASTKGCGGFFSFFRHRWSCERPGLKGG